MDEDMDLFYHALNYRGASSENAEYVFVENSPLLVGRGLVRVLADLAEMGFDARWGVVGAADVGAPHRRERCWVVAHAAGKQHEGAPHAERRTAWPKLLADANSERRQELHAAAVASEARQHPWGVAEGWREGWWTTEPDLGGKVDGLA